MNDKIKTFLLDYFQTEESRIELQSLPLKEHFIAKEISVKKLKYLLEKDVLFIDGDYELEFEFEYEVPEEHKDLPHFYREPMQGDFEIKIDENAKITIMNSSIGENVDGRIYRVSFR